MVEEDLMSRYSVLFLSAPAVEFAVTNLHIPAGVISLRMANAHAGHRPRSGSFEPALRDPLTSGQLCLGRAVAAGAATADY